MRVPFRQGIVNTGLSSFLSSSGGYATLTVGTTPFSVAIASGVKDYLWIEPQTVTNAWSSIGSQDTWLYLDLDIRTATRTFGTTTLAPIVSNSQPANPALNQHWFDTVAYEMKVWSGASWLPKVRVFVAKLANGSVVTSISMDSPAFTGSQIGDSTTVFIGQILFDTLDMPIKQSNGSFVTTEDKLRTRVQSTAEVKIASIQLEAQAGENLAKYTIVVFSDFGVIQHASLFSPSLMGQFGIIEQDITTGQLVNVVTTGVVTNIGWDWTSAGVNKPLYCDATGQLSATEQIAGQSPVAVIVDKHSIQLGTPLVTLNKFDFNAASTTLPGVTKLSLAPVDPTNPVAVGTNDLRLSDARTPLAHIHSIADVTNLQSDLDSLQSQLNSIPTNLVLGPISATDSGLVQFDGTTGKLVKGGLNITTQTTLAGNSNTNIPTEAAAKGYADTLFAAAGNVTGAVSSAAGHFALFGDTSGKHIQDSGIALTTSTTLAGNSDTNIPSEKAVKTYVDTSISSFVTPTVYQLACSDLVTSLFTTTNAAYFHTPTTFALKRIQISLLAASSSGSVSIQISKNGTPLAGSPFSIAQGVLVVDIDVSASSITLTQDDMITVDITVAGTGAKGLIVSFSG